MNLITVRGCDCFFNEISLSVFEVHLWLACQVLDGLDNACCLNRLGEQSKKFHYNIALVVVACTNSVVELFLISLMQVFLNQH